MKGYKLSKYVEKIFETPSQEYSEWFGYYNYDTQNSDHSKLLCNRIKEDGVAPRIDMSVEVGYYDIPEGNWHHVGVSDSWNWQQGCMAQWLNDDEIIYNTSESNHHIAIIHNIKTGLDRKINWAIYGITPDGKKSISLCMERAHWCRAYHYESVADESYDGRVLDSDGIFEIDLVNNSRKRIISINDIISFGYTEEFKNKKHWIEHVMISPGGSRFVFLHRFSSMTNVYDYGTRVFIADIDGSNLQLLPNWENIDWSHFGWNNDDSFAIYSYEKGRFRNVPALSVILKDSPLNFSLLLKRVYMSISSRMPKCISKKLTGRRNYYQYYKRNYKGDFICTDIFGNKEFEIDGHPSFIKGSVMITDTYPHRNDLQYLYKYDLLTKKVYRLGTFDTYYTGNPASCDLHPKVSRDGNYVVVDSAHDKKHHMIVLRLKQ